MLSDLRLALRSFARSPLFTAAVVLVLGLGVGASAAVFSLVDAYLIKPLPYRQPERIVSVWRTRTPERSTNPFSKPDFVDLKERASSFSHLATLRWSGINLSEGSAARGVAPEHVYGSRVNGDFFALFGVPAALGRTFGAAEDVPGRGQVVVLSDALFRRKFGADPAAIGMTVTLDGKPYEIVGVMPRGFGVPANLWSSTSAELWVPDEPAADGGWQRRGSHSWNVLGRLKPDVSFEAADQEVRAVAAGLERAYPDTNTNKTFFLGNLQEDLIRNIKPSLTMLFCATLLLLLIASANVALLLLVRASARSGEAAVRAALGASRPRLLRQFLTESALLALFGGALGFVLAFGGVRLFAAGYRDAAPALREAAPDVRVLLFALALASLSGLGFGLLPALRASRTRLAGLLKEGAARSTAGAGRRRAQAALLVTEIALSAVLLAGSAAVALGFHKALNRPLGFSTENVLTFVVHLPEARYPDVASDHALHDAYLGRLRSLPSVLAAGATTLLPLSGSWSDNSFQIEGKPPFSPGEEQYTMTTRVAGDYFAALGAPLLRGRTFTDADREGSTPVMVVSDAFARQYLPGEDPLGKRVRWGDKGPFREIVGVVGDVRHNNSPDKTHPASYVPFGQEASTSALKYAAFLLRTGADPHSAINAAREALRELDAELPIIDVKTYEERSHEAFANRRFTLILVSSFALSALLLTALGLFGLVSYQTRRRSRELAIRMALGAASADVQRLVLRDTSRLLLIGLALGLPAAFASGRLLASELEGVPPTDLLTLAATALLLGAVALAAVLAPARRAARTPPALVLRDE